MGATLVQVIGTVDVEEQHPYADKWKEYLKQEIDANNNAADQAAEWAIAFGLQMAAYFLLWDSAVDDRDDALDKQKALLDYLHTTDTNVDYVQMMLKQTVDDDLIIPVLTPCTDALFCNKENLNDGEVVDSLARTEGRRSCGGIPTGWTNNEGALMATVASAYTGAMAARANERRVEGFRKNKTSLMLRSQSSATMAVGPILKGYEQAAAIHEQLASIFLQGFNSAGAGLGVSLERMGGASASPGGA